MKNNLIFSVHFFLVILALLSPLLFSFKLIVAGVALLWIQYFIFGGCILTFKQFGRSDKDMTFWYYCLFKLGISANKVKIKIFVRYILPFFILAIALIWQILLVNKPILW